MRRGRLVAFAVLALAGCGVDPQPAPEDVAVSAITTGPAEPSTSAPGPQVTLWFLRGERLEAVTRSAPDSSPGTALELLAEGPLPDDGDPGLGTAVVPDSLAGIEGPDEDDVLTVDVTRAFSIAGDDQLREVAQVVWTATEFDGVEAVRFTSEDEPVEVPTDAGLTDQPVDRDDYASLAPAADPAEASATN